MIKIPLIFLLVFLVFSSVAKASDQVVEWQQSPGATGYKIEISVDEGVTWTEITNLTYETYSQTTDAGVIKYMAFTTITVPDNVLVLARVGAFNAVGTGWRLEAGLFYNSAWKPPEASKGFGVN